MLPFAALSCVGQAQHAAVLAHGAAFATLLLTFLNSATTAVSPAAARKASILHPGSPGSIAALRAIRAAAVCVVALSLLPAVALSLLPPASSWHLTTTTDGSAQQQFRWDDGSSIRSSSGTSRLRAAVSVASMLCFYAMQRHSVRSAKVENWVWIDEFVYHAVVLDNVMFWGEQTTAMLPTFAALAALALLQTVLPGMVVRDAPALLACSLCLLS
jgi:hypothetical protein